MIIYTENTFLALTQAILNKTYVERRRLRCSRNVCCCNGVILLGMFMWQILMIAVDVNGRLGFSLYIPYASRANQMEDLGEKENVRLQSDTVWLTASGH